MAKPETKPDTEKRIAELEGTIASAISLIESGERGSALRLLKTGTPAPPKSSTSVITGPAVA
jgi:hypothetical protein